LQVFVSGGTGYIGQGLIRVLIGRGHAVSALARASSVKKLPLGCTPVIGDALSAASFAGQVATADTFVHLVGASHPAPWKEAEFRAVDLASVKASVDAAVEARIRHFVYVSVAHPAPVMQSYIQVRAECEGIITRLGMNATFVRPWYVLGPGHRWPMALIPFYRLLERMPGTRDAALRLGLVTIQEMVAALGWAVENPPAGVRIISVPEIRTVAARLRLGQGGGAATPATAAR
jgi:uncharacterized protein YbjT (DUF2867 family)